MTRKCWDDGGRHDRSPGASAPSRRRLVSQVWRAQAKEGERAAASAVHCVIQFGQRSHWNRVDAHEISLWHADDPIGVSVAATDAGPAKTVQLRERVTYGGAPQLIIPASD